MDQSNQPTTEYNQREATYQAALALVVKIDDDLWHRRRHYRTRQYALLTRLDDVVRAILDDNLLEGEVTQ